MKILMLVNWNVEYADRVPADKQPPDYYVEGEDYWFYRYFREKPTVDVLDTHSFPWLERFEKYKIRFYILQALKAIPKLGKYDLIVSHGMQSGVVVSLWRRLFKTRAKHVVFDIGSFNSAAESGMALKLMQFASKSIDGVIYHTGSQRDYYNRFFPWIVNKSRWIQFGTDIDYFDMRKDSYAICRERKIVGSPYIICVGYAKRDWVTLVSAYTKLSTDVHLLLVGHENEEYRSIPGVEMLPVVPIGELIDLIRGALFCVLPLQSFNYSYGQMTLMQQMALEKCVVAAKVPSLIEYVIDGETAITYESCNADDLAEKMKLLLQDREMCYEIGKKARKWLENCCNEKVMGKNIEQYYETILVRRQA